LKPRPHLKGTGLGPEPTGVKGRPFWGDNNIFSSKLSLEVQGPTCP